MRARAFYNRQRIAYRVALGIFVYRRIKFIRHITVFVIQISQIGKTFLKFCLVENVAVLQFYKRHQFVGGENLVSRNRKSAERILLAFLNDEHE